MDMSKGIHTCHDMCQRIECKQRRELEELRKEIHFYQNTQRTLLKEAKKSVSRIAYENKMKMILEQLQVIYNGFAAKGFGNAALNDLITMVKGEIGGI